MALHILSFKRVNQGGFTLIELLIVFAIAGIIASTVTAAIYQTISGSARNTSHMTAVKQVENAIHWLRRDVQMAQTVQPSEGSGFPLSLTWTEWDNKVNQVIYSLIDSQLQRSHSIDGEAVAGMMVAKYVESDPTMTSCNFIGGVLTFKLTATLYSGSLTISETRVGEIISRPNSP